MRSTERNAQAFPPVRFCVGMQRSPSLSVKFYSVGKFFQKQ